MGGGIEDPVSYGDISEPPTSECWQWDPKAPSSSHKSAELQLISFYDLTKAIKRAMYGELTEFHLLRLERRNVVSF